MESVIAGAIVIGLLLWVGAVLLMAVGCIMSGVSCLCKSHKGDLARPLAVGVLVLGVFVCGSHF